MNPMYPLSTAEIRHKRRDLAPNQHATFEAFSKAAFADGALSAKLKQIIAVAVAQCPYCIEVHTKGALRAGARRRNAGSWCLCTLDSNAGHIGRRGGAEATCWAVSILVHHAASDVH